MIEYKTVRMKRKTITAVVSDDFSVIVKAPYFADKALIDKFVQQNEKPILEIMERKKKLASVYSEETLEQLYSKGKEYLSHRVSHFSKLTGFYPTSVGITKARTRFGSCSGKNSVNFSVYLFAYPEKVIDYVILHELCHIKHKNHSKLFYKEIEKYMSDYKIISEILKDIPNT